MYSFYKPNGSFNCVLLKAVYRTQVVYMLSLPISGFINAETHEEEETKSEGSAGSEWLVVSEDKGSGTSEPKSGPSSPVSETCVNLPCEVAMR